MSDGSHHGGAPGSTPGASPVPPPDDAQRERLRSARQRLDRVYGGILLVVGIFATILNMTFFTENALAQQFAALYEQYGVQAAYARPAGLGTLSLVGIIGHPLVYAVALYLALIVWRRGRYAAWIPFAGAAVAIAFSAVLMAVGIAMHPELLAAAQQAPGGVPTPTP